jgi:hypothetical protein
VWFVKLTGSICCQRNCPCTAPRDTPWAKADYGYRQPLNLVTATVLLRAGYGLGNSGFTFQRQDCPQSQPLLQDGLTGNF